LDFRNKYGTTEEQKDADKFVRLQKRPIPKIKWNALAITGALMRGIVFFCHVSPTALALRSIVTFYGACIEESRSIVLIVEDSYTPKILKHVKKIWIFVWDESKLHGAEFQVIVRCIIIYECTQICI
jgi:hypothetical protein